MNKLLFYQYMYHPELLDDRSLVDIEKIIAEYPYFQSAHLMHVKNLSNQGSISYDRELKRSAIWITNRRKLFYLLDNRVLLPIDTTEEQEIKTSLLDNIETIDFTALTDITEFEQNTTNDKNIEDELESLIELGSAQAASHFAVSDKLNLEDFKNTFSKNKKQEDHKSEKSNKKEHRKNLIDNFIIEQPKIKSNSKIDADELPPIKELEYEEPTMITDTLAKIYIKQEKFEKAIQAYEKLSLKYPEKNSYFANQIIKIKQLINNK